MLRGFVERNRGVFENKHGAFLSNTFLITWACIKPFGRASFSPRRTAAVLFANCMGLQRTVTANSVILRQPLATAKRVCGQFGQPLLLFQEAQRQHSTNKKTYYGNFVFKKK